MVKIPRLRSTKKIHERFLSLGFFPPELPSCFYSLQLGQNRNELLADFNSIKNRKNGDPDYYAIKANRTDIYFPRFGFEHRKHSLINPINYFFISKIISDNWQNIKKVINKSRYTSSKPIFDPSDDRAILKPNFDSRDKFEMYISSIQNYILRTDISRFFHSVYTHSIPWAIYGKSHAKIHRSHSDYGNVLDLLVRNSQDGQTIGLPVGPDTSRVIAEIIAAAIDSEIKKTFPKGIEAFRFVDDYIVGVPTRELGDRLSSLIRKVLSEYELDINHRKTSISPSGFSHLNGWKEEIRAIAPKVPFREIELERFFYAVEAIAKRGSEKNVYLFALNGLKYSFLRNQDWIFIENRLLSIARIDSSLIAPVCELLIKRNEVDTIHDKKNITKFILSNLRKFIDMRAYGELTWLLHTCIKLGISVKASLVENLFYEENAFLAILLSDMSDRALIEGNIKRRVWNNYLTSDGLSSHMWLYAYEGTLKNFTKRSNTTFITSHSYFKHLFSKKIEFYRSSGSILTVHEQMIRSSFNWQARQKTLSFGDDLDMEEEWDFSEVEDDFDDEYT